MKSNSENQNIHPPNMIYKSSSSVVSYSFRSALILITVSETVHVLDVLLVEISTSEFLVPLLCA